MKRLRHGRKKGGKEKKEGEKEKSGTNRKYISYF
jgi:hypothetical protein